MRTSIEGGSRCPRSAPLIIEYLYAEFFGSSLPCLLPSDSGALGLSIAASDVCVCVCVCWDPLTSPGPDLVLSGVVFSLSMCCPGGVFFIKRPKANCLGLSVGGLVPMCTMKHRVSDSCCGFLNPGVPSFCARSVDPPVARLACVVCCRRRLRPCHPC